VDENFLWDQLRPDHTVPYGPVLWRAPQALGPPQPSTTWSVPNGKRPGKDRPDFWCLNVVCPHPRSPGSVPNRDLQQQGEFNRSISPTLRQESVPNREADIRNPPTSGLPGVCPQPRRLAQTVAISPTMGSVPNRNHRTLRTLRTVLWRGAFPGTSCQATIAPSLRDRLCC
jgi:hypothetical protein